MSAAAPVAPVPSGRAGRKVIAALGIVQILTWGSSFYLLAVLARPVAVDTGWPLAGVVGALSLGMLVAGLASPRVGALIAAHGGRPVLAAGCALLCAGLLILAAAQTLAVFLVGWCVIGAGMAASLYDAAFAALGRIYGASARRAITTLTLWGGFASTVCWPLSAQLVSLVGWRGTCLAYAAVHAFISIPLVLAALPRGAAPPLPTVAAPDAARSPDAAPGFLLLCAVVTVAGAVSATVSVHLLILLQARGASVEAAVALGTLIGPSQVFARLIEMAGGGRHHPLWTLAAAVGLVALGLLLLAADLPLVALAVVAYGAGNGIYSIARGTVPLALFGPGRYAVLMGRLARPALLAQALAPLAGAALLDRGGAPAVLAVLCALGLLNAALVAALARQARAGSPPRVPVGGGDPADNA